MQTENVVVDVDRIELQQALHRSEDVKHFRRLGGVFSSKKKRSFQLLDNWRSKVAEKEFPRHVNTLVERFTERLARQKFALFKRRVMRDERRAREPTLPRAHTVLELLKKVEREVGPLAAEKKGERLSPRVDASLGTDGAHATTF